MCRHFVIMNLKELSAKQQRDAVSYQLKEADDFTHLAAFGEIRQKHDDIYREVAFKEETQRHARHRDLRAAQQVLQRRYA